MHQVSKKFLSHVNHFKIELQIIKIFQKQFYRERFATLRLTNCFFYQGEKSSS